MSDGIRRSPWMAVSVSSRHDLEEAGGSMNACALQSIYGSQVINTIKKA